MFDSAKPQIAKKFKRAGKVGYTSIDLGRVDQRICIGVGNG